MAAGGQEGLTLHGPGERQRWPRRWLCCLAWSWWRGKLFVTTPLPSHLFLAEHLARTAEEKAMLPGASSPGAPSCRCWSSRPSLPGPLTRRRVAPSRTPLSQERERLRKDRQRTGEFNGVFFCCYFFKNHISTP